MSESGFRALTLAVVDQALRMARRGDLEARRWLGEEGGDWLEVLGASLPCDWLAWLEDACAVGAGRGQTPWKRRSGKARVRG